MAAVAAGSGFAGLAVVGFAAGAGAGLAASFAGSLAPFEAVPCACARDDAPHNAAIATRNVSIRNTDNWFPHQMGIYIARFRNLPNTPPHKKFLRGFGYEGGSSVGFSWGAPGFGEAYKKAILEPRTSIEITGFGEVLPRWDNFVELDPAVKDIYGIPVLKIHMSDGENERAMIQDMGDSAGEMLEAAGARNIRTYAHASAPRWALHEAVIARMGGDPKKSVLNQFQQTHDIKNLFVMDASGFTSNPCQNPTLTIMALCVRSCDYLMSELKRSAI